MRKQKDTSTIETVLFGNILASLLGLPFLFGAAPTLADWAGMLFLGVFQIGLPSILIALAIKELNAVEAVPDPDSGTDSQSRVGPPFHRRNAHSAGAAGRSNCYRSSDVPLNPVYPVAACNAGFPAHNMTTRPRLQ